MSNQIFLNDLLHLSNEEIKLYKVKFNQPNREGTNPMDEYKKIQKSLITSGCFGERHKDILE